MGILQRTKLDLRGIGCFLAIAFGLAWLLELPMWLDEGVPGTPNPRAGPTAAGEPNIQI